MLKNIRNIKFLFLTLIFLSQCGYSPIYNNFENLDLGIKIDKTTGDLEINSIIKRKLSEFNNSNNGKIFNVTIDSVYTKKNLTKDSAGNATNYRLNLQIIFITVLNGKSEKFIYQEKSDMKKEEAKFEEEKYEKILKTEMINIIVQKFISQLSIMR